MHEDDVGETLVGIIMRGFKCLVENSSKKFISLCVNHSDSKSTLKFLKLKYFPNHSRYLNFESKDH